MAVKSITRQVFTASDGTPFFNASLAATHEFKLQLVKALKDSRIESSTKFDTDDRGHDVIYVENSGLIKFLVDNAVTLETCFKKARSEV